MEGHRAHILQIKGARLKCAHQRSVNIARASMQDNVGSECTLVSWLSADFEHRYDGTPPQVLLASEPKLDDILMMRGLRSLFCSHMHSYVTRL